MTGPKKGPRTIRVRRTWSGQWEVAVYEGDYWILGIGYFTNRTDAELARRAAIEADVVGQMARDGAR